MGFQPWKPSELPPLGAAGWRSFSLVSLSFDDRRTESRLRWDYEKRVGRCIKEVNPWWRGWLQGNPGNLFFFFFEVGVPLTLPETNSLHLKIDGWKVGRPIFRCYVSFWGCISPGLLLSPSDDPRKGARTLNQPSTIEWVNPFAPRNTVSWGLVMGASTYILYIPCFGSPDSFWGSAWLLNVWLL